MNGRALSPEADRVNCAATPTGVADVVPDGSDSWPTLAEGRWTSRQIWSAIAVTAVTLTLTFANLNGSRTLSSHEGYLGVTTRDMLADGDWIVPHFGGIPRLRKPPLGYWVTAASAFCCGGLNQFSARLPSAIAGGLLVALVGWWSARWHGRSAGLCSAFIQGTAGVHVIYARQAVVDSLLVLLMTSALYLIALQPEHEPTRKSRFRWLAIYFLLGLTALAKFHFGPVLVLGTAVAWWLSERRMQSLERLVHAPGVFLFLLLGAFWPFVVMHTLPEALAVWKQETMGRMLGELTPEPIWFYLLAIPGLFLPWTPLLFWSLLREIKRPWSERDRADRFLIVWSVAQVVAISLSSNKHDNYAMPMIPALSLYCGPRLATMLREIIDTQRRPAWGWLLTAMGCTPVVVGVLGVVMSERWPMLSAGIWIVAAAAGVLFCGTLALLGFRRHTASLATGTLGVIVLAQGIFGWLLPIRDYRLPTAEFLSRIRQHVPAEAKVCVFGLGGESPELFYVPGPVHRLESMPELRRQVVEAGGKVVVVQPCHIAPLRTYFDVEILDLVSVGLPTFDVNRTQRLVLVRAKPRPEAIAMWRGERRGY